MSGRKQTAVSELQSTWTLQSMNTLLWAHGECDTATPGRPQTVRTMMSHLAYQPLLPTGNKYLQQKWDKCAYDLHRGKVKSAKPTISMTPPKTFGLSIKLKERKLQNEWTMKIQRENNMLLEKISLIMRTTGRVDNTNDYERKSLGKEKRQLELLHITKENQMILLRLSQCRAHYNVRSWHEDWLKTVKLMDSIARYPRGRASQQKHQGRGKATKKCSDGNNGQKISADGNTHSNRTASNKEIHEKRKESSRKDGAGTETQQDGAACPALEPGVLEEKATSSDAPEDPGCPDTV